MKKPFIFRMLCQYVLLFILSFVSFNSNVFGQAINSPKDYTPSIVPINPTAASLAVYGNTPVNLYNGSSNITIPIYTIKKNWISLPIYLSYNSGGMKVEDIASWVGMGWSLNFGGSLSRQVRGKPDDCDSAYAVNLEHQVMAFLSDPTPHVPPKQFFNPAGYYYPGAGDLPSEDYFLQQIMNGFQDSEFDMYFLNMNGFSGKMFYDTSGHPVTIPNSRLKIHYIDLGATKGWKITRTDGVQFYFLDYETTMSSVTPVQPPNGITFCMSNWYISKIVNPENTDSIIFNYESGSYSYDGLGTEKIETLDPKWNIIGIGCTEGQTKIVKTGLHVTNGIKRLTKISGNGFEIDFIKKSAQRCDLTGDFALDNIRVKDWKNSVFNTYQFYQSYRVGHQIETSCSSTAPEYKRLFLDSIRVKSAAGIYEPYYKMKYNDSLAYPSRLSTMQDHWGYYSAKGDPASLIPSISHNRGPDSVWDQIGILKSLTYPTGGHTDFKYETNTANNMIWEYSSFPIQKMIGVSDTPLFAGGHVAISFTIPGPQRPIGDTISIWNSLMNSGSTLNPLPGSPDPPYLGNATIYLVNNNTGDSVEIPYRGHQHVVVDTDVSYTLKASYFLYDTTIKVFGLTAVWNYFQDLPQNKLVGGLRMKSITDYDGLGHQTNIRKFYYNYPGNDSSSGVVTGYPVYKSQFTSNAWVYRYTELSGLDFYQPSLCSYNTIQSFSNYPLLAGNNFPVEYNYSKIVYGNNGGNGMKEYYYSTPSEDLYNNFMGFPFPPPFYRSWADGLLQRENVYKRNGSSFSLVQSKGYHYNDYSTSQSSFSRSLKIGVRATYAISKLGYSFRDCATRDYFTFSGRSELASDTVTDYRNGVPVRAVTTYHYDPDYFYKTDESLTNSDGGISKTAYSYPPDMAASSVKTAMLNKNMIGLPVSTKNYNNGTLTSTVLNNYGLFNGNQVELKNKQSSTYNNALQTEVTFNKYDAQGNLLCYTTRQGISTVILWGYNSTYPVAQIEHVDTASLTTYLNANPTIQTTCSNPASDQALRNVIQQLRNQFPNALITGMTYRPPLGMTSKTDPNNMVTYYDYDSFGRLADIKNKDGKVLKKYTYHYRPQ